jgi:peptide/nickel transport system permease protein
VAQYILTRAFYSLITLWLLVTIIFGMVRLTGDPVKMYGEVGADKAYLDELRRRWGLDKPLYQQYFSFMGGLVQGDFGYSFAKSLKVRDIYLDRLPNSLKLGFGAFIISLALGIPLGMLSDIKVNTSWDSVGKVFALLGLSLPGFFVGLVLIIIFGVELGWLPVMGKGEHWWDWRHLVMPAFALGTLPGLNLLIMVNVAVVIEVIFNWPGVGQLLYDGLTNRDFPMVQGVVLMAGVMIVMLNFVIDILYAYIDPRIRFSR